MFEQTIRPMLYKILYSLTGKWTDIRIEYGILALMAAVAVPLKLLLFYRLIGVTANFFFVWLITCVLTYFLFASFKNKWIPAVMFLLLSILMFCDVTYSSFFNRYLSVNMLGAAGFLGDITESIKEVLKPWFFLILADALLVLAALSVRKYRLRKLPDPWIDELAKSSRRSNRERKKKFLDWVSDHKKPVTALLIICLLVFNFSGSFMITSLSNQEIYSYHIKDILTKLTGNSMTDNSSNFMYAITDSYEAEKNGPLFGVAKGRNLIVIQMESMQNLVVNKVYNGQEITPNLNQLIKGDTIYFDRYYQQVGSGNTSDAEFATNNSIYGSLSSYTYKLFEGNYFKGLPVLLKEQGYETAVLHAHEDRSFWNREDAYESLGFDTYYGGIGGTDIDQYDMTEWMGWGLTDTEFFQQSMPYLKKLSQPLYSFIITLSNHHPYLMLDKYQFVDLLPEDEGTIFGNYLNSAAYTDYAIGQLIQQLKDEGIYDRSIIALYGDHLGLAKTDEEIKESVSRFLGKEYDYDTMMNIPLIITVPDADRETNQKVSISGGQMDFLPTIAYLMGFESLDTVYLGHNLLTIDEGSVAEQTYMTKGSFFQDDIVYEMSRDGVFENGRAWNQRTGKRVALEDCYEGYMRSMGIINTSEYILKNDVLRKIYEENQDTVSAFSDSAVEIQYPDEIAVAGAPDKNLLGTNSLEALNAAYEGGYRNIEINICWTEDKEAVLLSSWKELSRYFDTDQSREITLEAFHNLKMKNGLTSMDFLDLIAWIKEHPDVTIYAQAERSQDYFMKCMESYAGSIIHQFVAEVPGMVEYSGLYPSVLNVDIGGNTVDQLLEFIELNHVSAVSLSKDAADGAYKQLLKADCISYIRDDENGILTKRN
ncbi:MAG: sulfatase-like hydrolase/transferase [Eubacteriales bacterium]|nr:sulfatase-like hydrolase/transferase [Eubacteriales bacterium]